jgi:hypothetical protein
MQKESTDNSIKELSDKIEYLDEMLKKDLFSNPVRSVQENIRNELLEFREIFVKNLTDLENYMVFLI